MFSPKKLAAAAEALGAVGDVPRDRDGKALTEEASRGKEETSNGHLVREQNSHAMRIAALEDRLAKLEHLVHSQARVAAVQEQQMERNTRFSALQIVAQSRGAALGPEDLSLADAIIGWLKMMPTVG